jgi:sirohydrochlorin cobaltochelatase
VLDGLRAPDCIVVPFFIADGWHVGTTIPDELGLGGAQSTWGGATIWYAKPVGTHPAIAGIVRDLVSVEPGHEPHPSGPAGSAATNGPAPASPAAPQPSEPPPARLARAAFLRELEREGESITFLEVVIRPNGPAHFELLHRQDAEREPSELKTSLEAEDAERVGARTTTGAHRPLRSAPDLAGGWRIAGLDGAGVWDALSSLYPAAAVHRWRWSNGVLPLIPFRVTAERQTGLYVGLGQLGDNHLTDLREERCEKGCLKNPLWGFGPVTTPSSALDAVPGAAAGATAREADPGVPCPAACPAFLSAARKMLENGPPQG